MSSFSALKPALGPSDLSKPEAPVWTLSFRCPGCGSTTSVAVSGRPAQHPVWKITPDPMTLLGSIQSGTDIDQQWDALWDQVSIEPSMQNLPHPRQSRCVRHFTVTSGKITNS